MARRKRKVEEQMDMLEEGGLLDEGNTVDPISGNDVPSGSTQEEVRDDIPAQLSEGEFVFPADVVRYIGLENLMQLRQKAKLGLQKMEDMGQMGNSEEATMSDDMEFNAEVDEMIDNLELAQGGMVPQDVPPVAPPVSLQPSTAMNRTYAQGGAVLPVEQEMMQKRGRGYAMGGAVMSVEQEMMQKSGRRGYAQGGAVMSVEQEMMQKNRPGFAPGGLLTGSNPLQSSQRTPVYQPPAQLPTYASLVQQPARQAAQAVQPVVEQKEYIGPNGERITIQFVNGNPATPIPEGYKPFDLTAQPVTPEIAKPEVIASQEDSSDDRERQAERDAQMARDKEISNTLASYDEEFAKQWAEDPFNTGKIGNPYSAIAAGVQTHLGRTAAIERIAEAGGIDLGDYENTGLAGVFSKYDDERFTRDLQSKYDDERFTRDLQSKREDEDEEDFPTTPRTSPTGRVSYDVDEDEPVSTPRGSEDSGTGGTGGVDSFSGMSETDKETQTQEDQDEMEDAEGRGELNRGGLASPKSTKPRRKPTMKRGALASKK